ncbi:MAG: hypothetical protein HY049_07320 [Acidobacteria bacterium]|nr:hypothetical protein [Acidobacteriota bacterium]
MSRLTGTLRAAILLILVSLPALAAPGGKPPLDFKVLKAGETLTGVWRLASPVDGAPLDVEVKPSGQPGGLSGTLMGSGKAVFALTAKSEGIGYSGEMLGLLSGCGMDRVPISDFLLVGDRILVQLDARPAPIPCPFLESVETARYYVAAAVNPIRLRGVGEITSERTREQIGLAGQRDGESTPILSGAVMVEGGTELKYRGRVRSLDGATWIEVEGIVAKAVGFEPPRGYVPSQSLRVAATITLSRPAAPAAPASSPQ